MNQPGPRKTTASLDGVELVYWQQAAQSVGNKTLVLLHGGASNHSRWSEFSDLTTLRREWNIIAPDIRGNGETMTRKNVNLSTWCSDLNDILVAEEIDSVVLVGHSLGAQIAIHFAARYPERLRGLVLIDTVFESSLQGKARLVKRYSWLVKIVISIILTLNRFGLHRRNFQSDDLRKLDIETRKALQGAESFEEIAKRYSALGPILARMPVANYLRQALATVSPLPSLEEIDVPVLAMISGGTTMGKLDNNKQEVAKFKHSEVVTLNANHWPLTETPEAVRSAIEAWISQLHIHS